MNVRRFVTCLLSLCVLWSATARATVTAVTVTPTAVTAKVGASNHFLLTWRVTSSLNSPLNSAQGRFLDPNNGNVLGTVAQSLSAHTVVGTAVTPTTIPEALTVPSSVLQLAASQGLGTLLYQRTFTDDTGPAGAGSGVVMVTVVVPGVTAASVTPSPIAANLLVGGHALLNWSVRTTAATSSVRSASGAFLLTPDGPVLQTVAQPLAAPSNAQQARLSEALTVPTAVVRQALAAHRGVLYYLRSFDAGPNTPAASAMVQIRIGGASSGALTLARLALHFNDGSVRRVVGQHSPLLALAEINYAGAGLLQAQWEVATPPSTRGEPVFMPIAQVHQYLLPGGHVLLQSPPLPVQSGGRYLVRLRVESPQFDGNIVLLRYSVNPAMSAGRNRVRALSLLTPDGGATLDALTGFAWQPISGARAYQLEFYPADAHPSERAPEAGMLVPASTTRLRLSTLARAHLTTGRSYRWRVLALADNGRVLAESGLRELVVP